MTREYQHVFPCDDATIPADHGRAILPTEIGGHYVVNITATSLTPEFIFVQVVGMSLMLDGLPVRGTNGWHGLTLQLATGLPRHPGIVDFLDAGWAQAKAEIEAWLPRRQTSPALALRLPYTEGWVSVPSYSGLPPASYQIDYVRMP